jgi:hypothetical protein
LRNSLKAKANCPHCQAQSPVSIPQNDPGKTGNLPTVENATTKSPLPFVPDEPVIGSDRVLDLLRQRQAAFKVKGVGKRPRSGHEAWRQGREGRGSYLLTL